VPTAAPRRVLASVVALALGVAGTLVAAPALAAPVSDPSPLAPVAGAVTSDRTPELRWTEGTSDWPDSLRYGVEVLNSSGSWVRGTLLDLVFDDDWAPLIPLPDGTYSWRVRGIDGFWSEGPWSAPATFVIDGTAPDLTLTSPSSGLFDGAGIAVAGTIADANPGTWQIAIDGTVVHSGTGPSFSHTIYPSTGAHTVTVTAVDAAGNSDAGSTASVAIDVDAEAPSLALTSPVDGSFVRPGPNVRFIASVQATGTRADLVLNVDGSPIHSVSTNDSRDVNRPVATGLWADGSSHVFEAVATDQVGQSTTLSATVTVDGSDPVVTVDTPTRHDVVSGSLNVGGTASDTGSGVASLELRLRPYDAAGNSCGAPVAIFAPTVASDGTWGGPIGTAGFPDGDYCLQARATDGVGNMGADQVKFVTFDNSAPSGALDGTFPSGWHMSVDHFAWTAPTDPHGVTYELALGRHPNVDSSGLMTELAWVETGIVTNEFDHDVPTGPHFYQVRAVDDLGNATAWTAPRGFQVIGVPVIVSPTEGQQFSASTITAEWTPVYGVGGVDRYEVEYGLDRDHDGTLSPEYRSVTGTGWNGGANVTRVQSFPADIGMPTGYEGPLSIRVRAVYEIAYPNAAGSVFGPWSDPVVNYVRDTGDPTLTISTPPAGAILNDDLIPVTLDASDPAGISRLVANLYTGGSFLQAIGSTPPNGALGVTASHTWNIPAGLAEGDYEIRASATDSSGKVTRVRQSFSVDSSAPVVTFTSPASNSLHAGLVTVSGTAIDSGSGVASLRVMVRLFEPSTGLCSGPSQSFPVPVAGDGSWTLALDTTSFTDGTYCIIGHAEDVLGNGNGQSTRLRGVTFDNTGPAAPQPNNPENGRTQANDSPLLDWIPVSDAVSYEVRTSASPARVPNVNDGELSGTDAVTLPASDSEFALSSLPQGWLWWQVRGIDALGNVGPWSNIWALGVDTVGPAVSLLTPVDGAVLTTGSFTLDWTDGETGATYEVRSSNDPSVDADGALDVSALTGTATASELALVGVPEATYYWQVRALDTLGNAGPWTTPWMVSVDLPTLSVPGTDGPAGGTGGTGGAGTGDGGVDLTTFALDDETPEDDEGEEGDGESTQSDDDSTPTAADPTSAQTGMDGGMIALLVGLAAALLLLLVVLLAWLRRRRAEA